MFFSLSSFSQEKVDEVVGYYMSADNNIILKFYRSNTKYYGRIVWIRYASRLDSLNPDVSKRKRKVLGSLAGWDFVYDGKDTWNDGKIYDANSGKIYKSKVTRDEKGNVAIRGYILIPILGRTEYFTKVKFKG
jgi:uncharacterized protein (DUF2147 family)